MLSPTLVTLDVTLSLMVGLISEAASAVKLPVIIHVQCVFWALDLHIVLT